MSHRRWNDSIRNASRACTATTEAPRGMPRTNGKSADIPGNPPTVGSSVWSKAQPCPALPDPIKPSPHSWPEQTQTKPLTHTHTHAHTRMDTYRQSQGLSGHVQPTGLSQKQLQIRMQKPKPMPRQSKCQGPSSSFCQGQRQRHGPALSCPVELSFGNLIEMYWYCGQRPGRGQAAECIGIVTSIWFGHMWLAVATWNLSLKVPLQC